MNALGLVVSEKKSEADKAIENMKVNHVNIVAWCLCWDFKINCTCINSWTFSSFFLEGLKD